jgi:hypothetical protein
LSQPSIAEYIRLQDERREEHYCNHVKPVTKFNLPTLFDCVLAPRIVDYNKLLSKIDHQNDCIMAVKDELNTFRATMSNKQTNNTHEEAMEKRIEEIITRSRK